MNYQHRLVKGLEFFAQAEMVNIFNEQGVIAVSTDVSTNVNDKSLAAFDPRTETPVEGVHWRKGPTSYQPARMCRFSFGIRF